MRWMMLAALVLSMTACGRWKGDGTDEVVPDVIGMTTGLKKSFGVPEMLAAGEHADVNLKKDRHEEAEGAEHGGSTGTEAPEANPHHGKTGGEKHGE